jgi:hypothetical protein
MSSNIKIVKISEYCNHEFIAKTTTTKCCSDNCSKRFYKINWYRKELVRLNWISLIKKNIIVFLNQEILSNKKFILF